MYIILESLHKTSNTTGSHRKEIRFSPAVMTETNLLTAATSKSQKINRRTLTHLAARLLQAFKHNK